MSDDTADPDESTDDEDVSMPEDASDEEDERPPIDDDERADVDLSGIAEEINEEEGEDTLAEERGESPDATEDGDTLDEEGTEADNTPSEGPSEGSTWGDMYVESLAVLLPEIAGEMSDDDPDMTPEEVVDLATQQPVELDAKFDAVVDDMGGMEELSDKQALLLSTAIVCGTVLLKEGDVAGDVVGRISDGVSA